jgi:pimeloyl-ACP methyl ester carboxylesterase
MADTNAITNRAVECYQSFLGGGGLLIQLDWQQYLDIDAPYAKTDFSEREVEARYHRNGYDWDIHGTLYIPRHQRLPGYAFVLIHGGGVNELDFQVTPDGRPGLARVLAAQGFQVLTPSYPGLWAPGGKWKAPVAERKPFYLFDRELSDDETQDRLRKATYHVYMQGFAALVEKCLPNHKLFTLGHSTGGPMAVNLYEYLSTAKVIGIVGWGSGACEKWLLQWREKTGQPPIPVGPPRTAAESGLGSIIYRSVEDNRHFGYEDIPELTPWGRLEQRFELVEETTPMFNADLQVISHQGNTQRLEEYREATGLPREEYIGREKDPDPDFLRSIKVLLVVGENDKHHAKLGAERLEDRMEGFVTKLYAETTKGARLVWIPKYTHMGHWALHNEKIVYLWLWAIESGYFGELH